MQPFRNSGSTVTIAAAALAVTLLLVYLKGLSGPFIFDDFANLADNPRLVPAENTPLDWRSSALSSESGPLRRALPMLSFALQAALEGELTAPVSKVINLIVHALCTLLVGLLAAQLARAPLARLNERQQLWIPLLAAAVWGLNPLHVSTVLYAVQRMAQFSTLFVLLGLVVFLHYRNIWARERPSSAQIFAFLSWFALAFLGGVYSKENAVLLPWLAAVVELVYFRGHIAGQRSRAMEVLSWSAFLLPTVAAISLILLNLDWIEAGYASRPFTLAERLLSQGRILWIYISWFLAPRLNELGMFHDDIPLSVGLLQPISTLLAAVAWPLVLACSVVVSRRLPEVLFATLFFVVAHCIESSVLALELVFEHRNYLPSVALAVWLATAFMRVRARLLQHEVGSTPATLPACVFVAVLALSTFVRASGWASEFDMSRAAVERHPESPRSGLFYANALLKRGNAEADAAQRSQLLGLARHEFELVYQSGEEQLAALVMLYVLDEQLYPGLSRSDAWLSGIERGTWERPLSATDFAAMSALVACFESDGCSLQATELLRLLDLFAERFSRPVAVHSLRLRVLKATGVGPEEILALAEKVLEESPESIQMRYEEIAFLLDLKRYAGAHEAAMALMAVDPERRQLPAIIDSFGRATGPAQEP